MFVGYAEDVEEDQWLVEWRWTVLVFEGDILRLSYLMKREKKKRCEILT